MKSKLHRWIALLLLILPIALIYPWLKISNLGICGPANPGVFVLGLLLLPAMEGAALISIFLYLRDPGNRDEFLHSRAVIGTLAVLVMLGFAMLLTL